MSLRAWGWCAAAVALGVAAGASLVHAVDVQITTVRASEYGRSDTRLLDLRPRLRRLVGYRAFRLVRQERRECAWRSPEAFRIPGGRRLHVVPRGMQNDALRLQVRLLEGPRALVDTDVRLRNRGVMLLGHEEDPAEGALIIMLRAEQR